MSHTVLAMVRERTGPAAMGAIARITVDEIRHVEMAHHLAQALGGYVDEVPDGLAYSPMRLSDASEESLAYWIVGSGCISETASLELLKARLAATSHPVVRRVLAYVLRDEAVHARLGWALAEDILPTLSRRERHALAAHAQAMFGALGMSFGTWALPGRVRARARRIRQVTSELGLGACPPDEEDVVCVRAITAIIAPRLTRLGLPLRRFG